jgi:hypothetical protein
MNITRAWPPRAPEPFGACGGAAAAGAALVRPCFGGSACWRCVWWCPLACPGPWAEHACTTSTRSANARACRVSAQAPLGTHGHARTHNQPHTHTHAGLAGRLTDRGGQDGRRQGVLPVAMGQGAPLCGGASMAVAVAEAVAVVGLVGLGPSFSPPYLLIHHPLHLLCKHLPPHPTQMHTHQAGRRHHIWMSYEATRLLRDTL